MTKISGVRPQALLGLTDTKAEEEEGLDDAADSPSASSGVRALNVSRDPNTGATVFTMTVHVEHSADDVIRAMDPQQWDVWSSSFSGMRAIDANGAPLADPPPPGSKWSGLVNEQVKLLGGTVHNYLQIDSSPGKPGNADGLLQEYDYALARGVGVDVFGISTGQKCVTDEGYVRIVRSGTGVDVQVKKALKFSDDSMLGKLLNTMAPSLGKPFLEQQAQQMIAYVNGLPE